MTHSKTKQGRFLLERIRVAKSQDELDDLLAEGDEYEMADPATKRRWFRASVKRRKELK